MKQVVALIVVTLIAVSLLPVQRAEMPQFANPAFQSTWAAERPVNGDGLDVWGNEPLLWRVEPYADAADGRRIVQYFDRGRMELTPDSSGQLIVTEGLLALEMTTGRIHLGTTLIQPKDPPKVPIDDEAPDGRVPTYASFTDLVHRRAQDERGADHLPSLWIDSQGTPTPGPAPVQLTANDYIIETGHNLPSVTTTLFRSHPFGSANWIDVMGYPISEPMWAIYRRGGIPLPSLVQVFQRRILVYTPSLPEASRFAVANTGRQYYRWRYNTEPPRRWPDPNAGSADSRITVPAGFQAGVVVEGAGTPIGVAIGPTGDLWVATEQGRVLRIAAEHGDNTGDDITVFADGLRNPRGIAVIGTSVYVSVDDGILQLGDGNLDGLADHSVYLTKKIEPANGSRGAPEVDQDGNVYVAGMLLPEGREQVVAQVTPAGKLNVISPIGGRAGPVMFSRNQLYVVDGNASGEVSLVSLPAVAVPRGVQDQFGTDADRTVVKFAEGTTVNATVMFGSGLWPTVSPETIFAAANGDNGGSVLRTMASDNGGTPELVDFATGFSKPVSIAVGLDGSLSVADAGRDQVVKIIVPAPTR